MALLRSDLFAALLVLSTFFVGCSRVEVPAQKVETGNALGTTYTIIHDVPHDSVSYSKVIESVFSRVNASMSTYMEDSDISRINKGDTTIAVDENFKEVFEMSKVVREQTDGVFDPTVGALVNAWGFGPGASLAVVDSAAIDSIMEFTGLDKVEINGESKVVKADTRVFLDFNALAKGFCVDLIGRELEALGVENYLVEVGGELLARGINTKKNKPWRVAVDHPLQQEGNREFIAALNLEDRAMATSGNYRKYRVDEATGALYVHTINPATGYPERSNTLSASVLAPGCMEADAYATAFMLLPIEKVKQVLAANPQLEAYIVYSEEGGELGEFVSKGFPKVSGN